MRSQTSTEDERKRALELYLEGDKSVSKISELISDEFGRDISSNTIYAWKRKYDWDDVKAKQQLAVVQKLAVDVEDEVVADQRRQLDSYKYISDKGRSALETLQFSDAMEATRAMDIGIQGERKVRGGLINLEFVQECMSIILNHIDDEDTLKNLAGDFRKLLMKYKDT